MDSKNEKIEIYVKNLISTAIQLPISRIKMDTAIDRYGIDSVMLMKIRHSLEKDLSIENTELINQYATLAEFAAYLIKEHADKF